MAEAVKDKTRPLGRYTSIVFCLIVALSVPFWITAIVLGWDAMQMPREAGRLEWAHTWVASAFAYGIAVGMVGASASLFSRRSRYRSIGLALALMGITLISLGFALGRHVEKLTIGSDTSLLPFIVPVIILFSSLITLANAFSTYEKPAVASGEAESTLEQPQPLSRP